MKNLKWFVVLIITFCSYTFADEPIKILVQLDGEYLSFVDEQGKEVLPQIINNRTMVPLRVIFESLGCDIDWNQETKTVTAVKNDTQISLTIDDVTAKVKNMPSGDEEQIVLDSAPVIIENRTLVPVRFIAESLDKKVSWVQESRTVVILDSEKLLSEIKTRVPHLQDILDLNLESINSFKSTGNLNATLDYQDKEDSTKNEKIDMKGTIDVISSGKDFQIDIDASVSGRNGSIMNSITSGGYDKFKYNNY